MMWVFTLPGERKNAGKVGTRCASGEPREPRVTALEQGYAPAVHALELRATTSSVTFRQESPVLRVVAMLNSLLVGFASSCVASSDPADDQPFIIIIRFPPRFTFELRTGTLAAVWRNGQVVRVQDSTTVGESYVVGSISPEDAAELMTRIRTSSVYLDMSSESELEFVGDRYVLHMDSIDTDRFVPWESRDDADILLWIMNLQLEAPFTILGDTRFDNEWFFVREDS